MQPKYAVFTMDVEAFGDTECVINANQTVKEDLLDGVDEYLQVLEKHNIKSTLFTVGSLAPKMEEKLKKFIQNGHELALHNAEHVAPMDMHLEEFREKVLQAKQNMNQLFHTNVEGFRAPFFSLDASRLNVLKELGFSYDSSHLNYWLARHTVTLDLKGYNRLASGICYQNNFFEFPMCKGNLCGIPFPVCGGAYMRLFPWCVMKHMVKRFVKKNNYYVFYLHPFELTTKKIPRVKRLKVHEQFYLQHGISRYKQHIEQIITMLKEQGFQFVTFGELSRVLQKGLL